ncbi:MAG TPA: hypothetical protein VF715_13900 [Thermoleophilaceae bacterium]
MTIRIVLVSALLLLVFVATSAALAQEPSPPAQQPPATAPDGTTPDELPPDEDDEELGEEIPGDGDDEEGDDKGSDPPADPGSGTGGSGGDSPQQPDPAPQAEARQDRLPRTGGDPIPLLVGGMGTLGLGLLLWSALPPPRRP